MKFSDFAMIMAMYPTTSTEVLAEMFGETSQHIRLLANSCHIYKEGRKRARHSKEIETMLVYNARTAEVHVDTKTRFVIKRSKKPVKLQVTWEEL